MKKTTLVFFALLAAPVFALAAAAPAATTAAKKPAAAAARPPADAVRPAPSGKLFETIRKRGTLLVGTSWNIPWVMRDPQGEFQGFEIDVARQLAADLGVDLTLVAVPFPELTDAVQSGKIDVVVAGYSITPQRALVVDFSNPYGNSALQLIVHKDLAAQDIDRADLKIGARAGTTGEAAARNRLPKTQIVAFPDERSLYAALRAGAVDGALAYSPRTTMAVAQSEGKLAVATGVTELPHTVEGFAVRKGEQGMLNFLNAWIAYWQADGWLDERRKYWFETFDWTTRFGRAPAAK
jgi:polar amino acid transport system substrate-binding protein